MDKYDKTNPEFWKRLLVDSCEICEGRGVVSVSGDSSVKICKCMRMVRFLVKMHDPIHGVRTEYHKFKLDNLHKIDKKSKKLVQRYLEILSGADGGTKPYRNSIISSSKISIKS